MGRSSIVDGIEPATFDGRLVLRRVHLNSGGYDRNGTYFGYDLPLYWYAFDDGERTLDCMLRASNRADAKAQILKKYPLARFYR